MYIIDLVSGYILLSAYATYIQYMDLLITVCTLFTLCVLYFQYMYLIVGKCISLSLYVSYTQCVRLVVIVFVINSFHNKRGDKYVDRAEDSGWPLRPMANFTELNRL